MLQFRYLIFHLVFTITCGGCSLMWIFNNFSFDQIGKIFEGFTMSLGPDYKSYPVLPEADLTTMEIIKLYGYRADAYDVVTADGYILQIHRIRSPKYKPMNENGPGGHPVIVQHGILTSSASWVLNGRKDSLGFVLADDGYDVWLSNLRGNRYSKRHLRLSPDDDAFWDYSLDEHAMFDLPAIIDHVLKVTYHSKLSIVAHSLGTTVTMMMLASKPQYNQKLQMAALMAPVMYGRYLKNPLRLIVNHIDEFTKLISKLGMREILPRRSPITKGLGLTVCTEYPLTIACEGLINTIGGYNHELIDRERMHLFITHYDTGSWKLAIHFSQIFNTYPSRLDLGPETNTVKYGQRDPPAYNLSQVSAPVAIFYGYMDLYVDQKDLQRLVRQLQNVVVFEQVPYDIWTHQDFVIAKDVTKHFYRRLLQVLQSHTPR